jgi:hypothetical protein
MKAYETSATVEDAGEIRVGVPFEPGTQVAVTISPEPAAFAKQAAYDQLAKVSQECGSANWDSEGADAVEQNTVQNAYLFLKALPPGYPLPDISAEPDGHLNLEWYRGTRCILSVSVSPESTLYWAALIGTEDPRGSCLFNGDIPDTILYWIRRVSAG